MKKAAIIIVSLFIGSIIGYWFGYYNQKEQIETKRQFSEIKKQNQSISTFQHMYYTGNDDGEDVLFQQYDDFGPV